MAVGRDCYCCISSITCVALYLGVVIYIVYLDLNRSQACQLQDGQGTPTIVLH